MVIDVVQHPVGTLLLRTWDTGVLNEAERPVCAADTYVGRMSVFWVVADIHHHGNLATILFGCSVS
jgi:hypothetical protein